MEKYEKYITDLTDWTIRFAPKVIAAVIVLVVGLWIANRVGEFLKKSLVKSNISTEILSFLGSIIDIVLKIAVILFAASIVGFEVSSLFALIAAIGFAVGMALQGFLGNFASGITIVFLKPYRIGDWVEISEKFGKVESIQIFNTTIETPNQKTLIIPNGQVTDNIITNFSTKGSVRLELKVTMPYSESFPRVKEVITQTLRETPKVIQEDKFFIGIEDYDSHNITITIRPLINPDDFWEVKLDTYERIKSAFHKNDVKVAYSEGVEMGSIGQ